MIYILILSFIILCVFWIIFFLEDLEFTRNNFKDINFIGIFTFLLLNISAYLIITIILGAFYWIFLTLYHTNYPCDECRFIQCEKIFIDKNNNKVIDIEHKWHHCNYIDKTYWK